MCNIAKRVELPKYVAERTREIINGKACNFST